MSKLLFVVLAVLALSRGLKAETRSYLNVTLVTDLEQYRADNPGGLWEAVPQNGMQYTLGHKGNGPLMYMQSQPFLYLMLLNPSKMYNEFSQDIRITCIVVRIFSGKRNGRVYLVDGGIGQYSASLVVAVPKSIDIGYVKVEVYGV